MPDCIDKIYTQNAPQIKLARTNIKIFTLETKHLSSTNDKH